MRNVAQIFRPFAHGLCGLLFCLVALCDRSQVAMAWEVDRIQLGECELSTDPLVQSEDLWFLACLQARYGWEQRFIAGAPDENGQVRYAGGYVGLHLNRFLSFHGSGLARHYLPTTPLTTGLRDERAELLVVQLGNPVFHKFRLMGGRMSLPFGINFSPVMEGYRLLEQRLFWDSPSHGLQVTYDNLRDVVFDAGVGTSEYAKTETAMEPNRRAVSARGSADFPALDGSRLIFSGYWEDLGPQRFGFGFVTVSHRSDVTQFEWVRVVYRKGQSAQDKLDSPRSDQLFRVGYLSQWRSSTRWAIQYDDLWRLRRSFIFGYDFSVQENVTLRSGLSLVKQLTAPEDYRYVFSVGVEAHL